MRELKVVGLDVDGKRIICECAASGEKFLLRSDDRLRAAVRGEKSGSSHPSRHRGSRTCCVPKTFKPRSARAHPSSRSPRPRASTSRVERFAHPVLLERSRAAELATAAHPVLADGPAVLTLLETVTTALVARGLDPDATAGTPGATRTAAGRCSWLEGRQVGQRRALPVHPRRARWHRDRFDDAACRAHRPRLRPPAAIGGAGSPTRLRGPRARAAGAGTSAGARAEAAEGA